MDLGRHLHQEPVVARPPSRIYRLQKFIRRNRVSATSAAIIAVVLCLAVALSTWEAREQKRLRQGAQQARQDSTEKLWSSYLAEARARRNTSRAGRRSESLAALRNAAAIPPTIELRNEAIACLVLTDLRRLEYKDWETSGEMVVPDRTCERYAIADGTGVIRIRHFSDDHELGRLPAVGSAVTFPSRFSPDGKLVGFCYGDHRLRVWDWANSVVRLEVQDFCDAEFSPDSTKLATSDSTNLVLYDVAQGKKLRSIPCDAFVSTNAISEFWSQFRFHPAGVLLALSSRDQTNVLVVDTASGETRLRLPHAKPVFQVAWHPGGRYLASGCADQLLHVWDTATGELIKTIPCNAVSVGFSHGGSVLAASGWDGETHLWEFPACRHLVATGFNGFLSDFNADDTRLILSCWKQAQCMARFEIAHDLGVRTIYEQALGADSELANLTFSSDGKLLAYTTSGGVRLWDVEARREVGALEGQLTVLGFEEGNQNLLLVGSSNLFRWSTRSPISAETSVVRSSALGPMPARGTARVGWLSANGRVCAIQAGDWCEVFRTDTFTEPTQTGAQVELRFVAVSPDGSLVAGGAWNYPGVKVWGARTGRLVKELRIEDQRQGTSVAFSPDGRRLVTSVANEYDFWDTTSWELALHIADSGEYVPARMAFSHDGRIFAGTVLRKTVRLYDAATGRVLADLEAPDSRLVSGLAFSPDDTQLAVCGMRVTLRVWDLRWLREQLKGMNLDWELPPYPPKTSGATPSSFPATIPPKTDLPSETPRR